MKKIVVAFILCCYALIGFAQNENPVSWSFTAKKIDALSYEVHLSAKIEEGWHIYSQTTPDGGPVPTEISFAKNPLLIVNGSSKEVGKLEQRNEPLFGVEVKQFSDKVDFVQTVKLKTKAKTNVTGTVKFMTCNDQMCIPPKSVSFTISLK
jgi:DsbC/DsbD-like thiol-disulfide interchange protein